MDWTRYKELEREEADVNAANPVTVTYTYEEFLSLKYGLMLLRRMTSENIDLQTVDNRITPIASKISEAFRANPGTQEMRDERMRMLEARRQAKQVGPPVEMQATEGSLPPNQERGTQ